MNTQIQYPIHIPQIVSQAKASAKALGFDLRPAGNLAGSNLVGPSCCIDQVGRLLMTLAGTLHDGLIGEIGTGAGVGTAWLHAGINIDPQRNINILTVEPDPKLARAARQLFTPYPVIEVLEQDWREDFQTRGPFSLLFADGGGFASSAEQWASSAELLAPGGILVIDDVTPEAHWPVEWRGQPDPKREFAFHSGYFQATEVLMTQTTSALILARR